MSVVSLRGAAVSHEPVIDAETVERLEELLTLAKDGQITGFIYGSVLLSGNLMVGWVGSACHLKMVAAAAKLQHRVMIASDEGDDA